MNALHEFQTGSGDRIAPTSLERPGDFYDHAAALLEEAGPQVFEEVVPKLESYEGKWHPLGFMAYKLGSIAGVGALRLDIWPEGLRHESPRGPKIHDHAWHLASLVNGEYTDVLYDVEEVGKVTSEEERNARDLLRVYSPRLSAAVTSAALCTDGTCARATAVENRRVTTGNMHTIDVGVFHITDIPLGKRAATVLIESPIINTATRILMDTAGEPLTNPKREITPDEAAYAKAQIL
ncbi:MAG TPA: hypothetical protein VLF60_05600 [Candidatus Saccharimonadales bacterium]|nr:hypothetical protein [Candidatus Saccharimonadales bacterium]